MNESDDIATRIANVILSPESIQGALDGALSVPMDLGYMIYGTFDTDSRFLRQSERIRIANAVRRGILHYEHLCSAIKKVFEIFTRAISEGKQNSIYSYTSFALVGRFVTNGVLSSKMTTTIASHASIYLKFIGAAGGNILLIGGMIERSIRTSKRLMIENPEVYQTLRPMDYDILYFLIEPALAPFVDALNVKRTQGDRQFGHIIDLIEKKIDGQ